MSSLGPTEGADPLHTGVGSVLTGLQIVAIIALGIIAMLSAGVLPVLLGALQSDGRLTESGIGMAAMIEPLSFAIVLTSAGVFCKPQRLKLVAVLATVALVIADLAPLAVHTSIGIIAVRAVAGIPEGALAWLLMGMLARSAVPERWSGLHVTALTSMHLVLSAAMTTYVLRRFGADGGFVVLALASLPGLVFALAIPDRYEALPKPDSAENFMGIPARGLFALLGTMLFSASTMGLFIYLVPLAHYAGVSSQVAGTALIAQTAAEIAGAALATVIAGRIGYFTALVIGSVLYLVTWPIYGFGVSSWGFIAAEALTGLLYFFQGPYLYPMVIDADPSRRAAVQSGAATMAGGVLGPLLAAWMIDWQGVRGVLCLSWIMVLTAVAIIAGLHCTSRRAGIDAAARRQAV